MTEKNNSVDLKATIKRDRLLLVLVSLITFMVCILLDAFDYIVHYAEIYEAYEVDELLPVFIVLASGLIWYSRRRVKELHQKNQLLTDLENKLQEVNLALEKKVTKRTEALKQTNDDLKTEVQCRKQVEQKLLQKNRMLDFILDTSAVGICIVENKRVVWVSGSIKKIFGYPGENEYIGMSTKDFFISEEEHKRVNDHIYLNTGDVGSGEMEVSLKRKDGSVFKGYIHAQRRQDSQGLDRVIIAVSDESWRQQAEKEKDHAKKLQGVIEMAGAVCHEMNQPLQAATGYISMLADKNHGIPEIDSKLHKIMMMHERMTEITRKLAMITTYETKEYVGDLRIVDIEKSSE